MKTLLSAAACLALICIALASPSFAQTQLVTDTFDGSSGTPLGPNWTGCGFFLGTYNKLSYENNAAGGGGYYSQECALYTGYGDFPSDQYATATVVVPTPSNVRQAAVQLRQHDIPSTPESYISCGWNAQDFPADFHYRIWSMAPNPSTGGPSSLYLSTVSPATNDVIYCQVLGNVITMKVNDQIIATVIDNSGLVSGYPGLYYVDPNGSGPSTDDVIFDNFAAGSGPALVSLIITPSSATVPVGSFVQFTGVATYADGTVASLSSWTSSDTTLATVDGTGLAFTSNPGSVTITGGSGSSTGTATISVQPANGYTPLVHDSFTGPTGNYLGSNWTGCGFYAGAYSELVYQNNQAGGGGYYSQECAVYTGYGTFPGDQYATAVVVAPTPSSTPQAGVQLRQHATPNTAESYLACGWDAQDFAPDYHYRIWSMQPDPPTGGPTSLYLSKITPQVNDVIWCQVLGTEITMQVNGSTIAVVNDTSGVTSGFPGLYYIDPNGDVPPITDVIFDNFVAGQITSPVLASIAITPTSTSVGAGSYVQFTATGTYTDGSTANVTSSVTWSSSNTSVATVSSSGLAYGAGGGIATITASSGTVSSASNLTVVLVNPTVSFTGAPSSAPYAGTFTVRASTNAPVMPTISGTPGICSVGPVTGTPASASAVVTMLVVSGTCKMNASWAAGGFYTSAGPLTQSTSATKAPTTTTITSNTPNPSAVGQAVTISFAVSGAGVGPNGSVTVTASTGQSCSATLNSGSTGSCSITFASGGTRTLTARYGGSSTYNSSTSAGVSQIVSAPAVSLSPSNLNFGSVTRGSSQTKSETVTNTGTAALTNFSWSITGFNANEFTISSTTCGTAPATLQPGASCILSVTFKPNATGTQIANLSLTDNAANSPQSVALSGSGK
jgi:hypothetical protein